LTTLFDHCCVAPTAQWLVFTLQTHAVLSGQF